MTFPDPLARQLDVSRETVERLKLYESKLRKWMPFKNLIGPSTLGELWTRHFADSLQLLSLAPKARRWVDIGSGAGFPGMVIAAALVGQRDAVVHLIEADNRKCAFLREVARDLKAPVQVHHGRAEDLIGPLEADVVTARAVTELSNLFRLAAPLLNAGALALFPKGREYESELAALGQDFPFSLEIVASLTAVDGKILLFRPL
jgi:16S rRNA (guanine527-N7)-methyltransferase